LYRATAKAVVRPKASPTIEGAVENETFETEI
jgi:hypothetical protein